MEGGLSHWDKQHLTNYLIKKKPHFVEVSPRTLTVKTLRHEGKLARARQGRRVAGTIGQNARIIL
jgi:hypothetical protein